MLAFNLGGGEVILCLALVLILFGSKRLPELARGMRSGFLEIRRAFDDLSHDAGKSVGGIYGKPAGEALAHDNKVAELYDPAVFEHDEVSKRAAKKKPFSRLMQTWQMLCIVVRKLSGM